MPLIKPDFSEIQEDVAPGTYKVMIKKGEVKDWPSGGQYVNWEMETFGEADPKNNGRRIFDKTSTSGKAAFRLQRLYKAATGQALTGAFDTDLMIGRKVEVEIIAGMKNGQPTGYTEVKTVRPVQTN